MKIVITGERDAQNIAEILRENNYDAYVKSECPNSVVIFKKGWTG